MTLEEELAVLKIAYGNAINDLARTRNHLNLAEDTLRMLARTLADTANNIGLSRADNPGTGGSGGTARA